MPAVEIPNPISCHNAHSVFKDREAPLLAGYEKLNPIEPAEHFGKSLTDQLELLVRLIEALIHVLYQMMQDFHDIIGGSPLFLPFVHEVACD